MADGEQWVFFDDDDEEEKLSLCDLPVVVNDGKKDVPQEKESVSDSTEAVGGEDFEFRTCGGGGSLLSKLAGSEMCAADEVFFQGQILPLRPSVSSDCGLLPASWGPSRCGSRSDSLDRCSSAVASLAFTASRSVSSSSSSRSSGCISRSHSSNSFSSTGGDAARLSVSNNFYAHPSPTPQVRHARRSSSGGSRRSTGSSPPGWGLFRLGVVQAPEIELYDLRSRRASSRRTNHDKKKQEKNSTRANDPKCSTNKNCSERDAKMEKKVMRFLGRGFGCNCSPDSIDAPTSEVLIARKKKEPLSLKRGESTCRTRIFEWLEELSVAKPSMG